MSDAASVRPASSRSPAAHAVTSHRLLPIGTPTTAMSCTSGEWTVSAGILPWRRTHLLAVHIYPEWTSPHYVSKLGPESGVFIRVGSTNREADAFRVQGNWRCIGTRAGSPPRRNRPDGSFENGS